MGVLELLHRKYADGDERARTYIEGALQSANRAKTLVQRLLGFARRQSLETEPVDLCGLVSGAGDLIKSSIGPGIELRLILPGDLPHVSADANQLELALLNLCVNARDAMSDGGVLTISAEPHLSGPRATQLKPGAYVKLSIIDTGTGMDADTLARAVEPFFTTKDVGRGTGLGLSMVHGLAAQLGGTFDITSAVGRGTRADLYLPIAGANAARGPHPARLTPQVTCMRALRILLVDDEPLVREGTAEMLRELGHEVIAAASAVEALHLFRREKFELLITDYKMPQMDGGALIRAIRATASDFPILLVTGYSGSAVLEDVPQLAKPFMRNDLAEAINALLPSQDNVVALQRRPT